MRPRQPQGRQTWCAPLLAIGLLSGCVGEVSEPGGPRSESPTPRTDPRGTDPVVGTDDLDVYSRLTKPEYRFVVADLLVGAPGARRDEVLQLVDGFNENNYSGYYKNYDPISVYPGLESAQLDLARGLATAFVESDLYQQLCASSCSENVADLLLPRIWKRRVSASERQELADLYSAFPPESRDYYFFLRVFASPYFHYKIFDRSPEDADAANIKTAQIISYALTGSFPDAELQEDADSGAIAERTRREHHVLRLLEAHPTRFAQLFLPQWLGMASSGESGEDYQGVSLRSVMLEPALIFAEALEDGSSVSSLIDIDFNYVDSNLAALYGAGPNLEPGWQKRELTQSLFGTAAMSYLSVDHESGNPSPIRRGSYVVNHFLCRSIAFPPSEVQAEVDRIVSSAPEGLSPPERMAYFRSNATCAGCHNQFDPYGLALEEIGAFGQVRSTYYTGDAIEAVGTAGDISYTGSIDFSNQLAQTPAFTTCFASQVYSYMTSSRHTEVFRELQALESELVAMSASEIVAKMVLRALGDR